MRAAALIPCQRWSRSSSRSSGSHSRSRYPRSSGVEHGPAGPGQVARPGTCVAEQHQARARHVRDRVAARRVVPVHDHRPVGAEDDVAGMQVAVAQSQPADALRDQGLRPREPGVDLRGRYADLADEAVPLARERRGRDELEQRELELGEAAADLGRAVGAVEHVLPHRHALDPLPDARRATVDPLDAQQPGGGRAGRAGRLGVPPLALDPVLRHPVVGRARLGHLHHRAAPVRVHGRSRATRYDLTEMPMQVRLLPGVLI